MCAVSGEREYAGVESELNDLRQQHQIEVEQLQEEKRKQEELAHAHMHNTQAAKQKMVPLFMLAYAHVTF